MDREVATTAYFFDFVAEMDRRKLINAAFFAFLRKVRDGRGEIELPWKEPGSPRDGISVEPSGDTTSVIARIGLRCGAARIDPLPTDDWRDIPAKFIGRELQLINAAEAFEGLRHRARTGEPPGGSRVVKVIWVHGFGGMGKSWYLHQARLQAGADVRALIVDWDSPFWHLPLMSEPRFATELFETIAHRLVH